MDPSWQCVAIVSRDVLVREDDVEDEVLSAWWVMGLLGEVNVPPGVSKSWSFLAVEWTLPALSRYCMNESVICIVCLFALLEYRRRVSACQWYVELCEVHGL